MQWEGRQWKPRFYLSAGRLSIWQDGPKYDGVGDNLFGYQHEKEIVVI